MIITERKNDADEFLYAPIYFLTGDLETAKFYSNLASATAKFGTYLEKQIKETVSIPIINYSEINTVTKKSLLAKQNIDGVIPDFIIIDPKTNDICMPILIDDNGYLNNIEADGENHYLSVFDDKFDKLIEEKSLIFIDRCDIDLIKKLFINKLPKSFKRNPEIEKIFFDQYE